MKTVDLSRFETLLVDVSVGQGSLVHCEKLLDEIIVEVVYIIKGLRVDGDRKGKNKRQRNINEF